MPHSQRLRIDICGVTSDEGSESPPAIAFNINKSILRAYSANESSVFIAWMRRCTSSDYRKACLIYPNTSQTRLQNGCHYFAPLDQWDHFCYDQSFEFVYMVIDGFRFFTQESLDAISFILNHPLVSVQSDP